MTPRIAIYAGSFDPITRGHEDIIKRSRSFADKVIVAIATNSAKAPLFSLEERLSLIKESIGDDTNIEVTHFHGLLVDFAKKAGASMLIRGLRAVSDFEYEFQMAIMNRHLASQLETIFMVPSVETTYISSSIVREVARYGGNIDALVSPAVAKALRQKFTEK